MTAPDQADAHEWTAITTPRLLAVPLVLFWAIWEEQKLLMPHKIKGLVLTIINEADEFDKAGATDNWQFVLSWCLLAAQQDANGSSHLGLPVDAVTKGDDDYFEKWIYQRLDAVCGPRPNTGAPRTAGVWGSTHP